MEDTRENLERALNQWKHAVEEFGISGGVVDAAFKRMYRDRFKECEVVIVNSSRSDHALGQLVKDFESGGKTLCWRAAYLMGEVIRLHPQASRREKVLNTLLRYTQSPGFQIRSNDGTEVINALGKSEDSRAASPLTKILKERWSEASGVPHVFVSLGKVGNVEAVEALTQFMSRPKMPNSARIYLPWSLGMIGRLDCNRAGFPLPRLPFRPGLKQLQQAVEAIGGHPDQYRHAIYAIGRICDQRQTLPRPIIELDSRDLNVASQVLEHKRSRLGQGSDRNSKQLTQMIDLALTMIDGTALSSDQIILLEKVETILLVKVDEGGPALQ